MTILHPAKTWFSILASAASNAIVTDADNNEVSIEEGIVRLRVVMRGAKMTYLIGNGGSLAIAMHLATDFNLTGWPSIALCDPVALTSHANDFGVEAMFTKQLETWRPGTDDVLIALSCSGRSPNIIKAVEYARKRGLIVVTLTGSLTGFPSKLSTLGGLNFYVPSRSYGIVQLAHEAILHAACDIEAGRDPSA